MCKGLEDRDGLIDLAWWKTELTQEEQLPLGLAWREWKPVILMGSEMCPSRSWWLKGTGSSGLDLSLKQVHFLGFYLPVWWCPLGIYWGWMAL